MVWDEEKENWDGANEAKSIIVAEDYNDFVSYVKGLGFDITQILPADAESLSNKSLVPSNFTLRTGFLSQGNDFYEPLVGAGSEVSYIVRGSSYVFLSPSTQTTFNNADKGVLQCVINNISVDTFDLGANFVEANRDGNQTYTPKNGDNNIITVTSVGKYNNFNKWQKGNCFLTIPNNLLRQGYNEILLAHNVDGNITQTNTFKLFFDDYSGSSPYVATVNLQEYQINSNFYLSGVRYYSLNDQFLFSVQGFNLFDNTYVQNPIEFFGLSGVNNSSIAINDGAVSGVSGIPVIGETMNVQNKILTLNVEDSVDSNARITALPRNVFGTYTSLQSSPQNFMIITYTQGSFKKSTSTYENFSDEFYRLPLNFDFDDKDADLLLQWNSNSLLSNGNAQCGIKENDTALIYPQTNFVSFKPTNTANYSTFNGSQEYVRYFLFDESETNLIIRLKDVVGVIGTDIDVQVKLPTQTGWLDCTIAYSSSQDITQDGSGALVGNILTEGEYTIIRVTFGGKSTIDSNGRVYFKLILNTNNATINNIEVV